MCIRDRYQRRVRGTCSRSTRQRLFATPHPAASLNNTQMSQGPEEFSIDAAPSWSSLSASQDLQDAEEASCSLEQSWQLIDQEEEEEEEPHDNPSNTPTAPTKESIARWARIRNTPSYQNKRESLALLGQSAPVNPSEGSTVDAPEARQQPTLAQTLQLPRRSSNPSLASSSPGPAIDLVLPVLRQTPPEWTQALQQKEDDDFWDDLLWPGVGALLAIGGMIYIGAKYHRRRLAVCA
eukprot:TRINITY_DN167_c0_g4_i1.p1 TRINITY_DN167_c0_g4~~TRINITY_DN167_c0_g4_i1.p1  ORF type:complete len:237 (+),score=33.82 TRINITY_DN167_c0_g4_i1:60-770(+)